MRSEEDMTGIRMRTYLGQTILAVTAASRESAMAVLLEADNDSAEELGVLKETARYVHEAKGVHQRKPNEAYLLADTVAGLALLVCTASGSAAHWGGFQSVAEAAPLHTISERAAEKLAQLLAVRAGLMQMAVPAAEVCGMRAGCPHRAPRIWKAMIASQFA